MKVRAAVFGLVASVIAGAFAAGDVSIVDMRQRWPWGSMVDVDYVYSGTSVTSVSFTATWDGQMSPVDIVDVSANGIFSVKPGLNHFTWYPASVGLEKTTLTNFKMEGSPCVDPRTYLVVDLVDGGYSFLADVPEGGWGDEYKTRKVAFRRIPAGTYTVGTSESIFRRQFGDNGTSGNIGRGSTYGDSVTITHDYYFQVFAFTAAQLSYLTGSGSSSDMRPATGVRMQYSSYRGSTADDGTTAIDWPHTGYTVNSGSYAGLMRAATAKTGQRKLTVDLPTDAQWQIAVGCGTTNFWTTGGLPGVDEVTITNLVRAAFWNKPLDNADPKDHAVGLKAPNAWGIYDFNVRPEPVLDWVSESETYLSGTTPYYVALPGGVDPKGPSSSVHGYRLMRGTAANGLTWSPRDWTIFARNHVSADATEIFYPPRFAIVLDPDVAD